MLIISIQLFQMNLSILTKYNILITQKIMLQTRKYFRGDSEIILAKYIYSEKYNICFLLKSFKAFNADYRRFPTKSQSHLSIQYSKPLSISARSCWFSREAASLWNTTPARVLSLVATGFLTGARVTLFRLLPRLFSISGLSPGLGLKGVGLWPTGIGLRFKVAGLLRARVELWQPLPPGECAVKLAVGGGEGDALVGE